MADSSLPVDYQRLFRALPENLLLMPPDATIIDNTDGHVAASLKPREDVVRRSTRTRATLFFSRTSMSAASASRT
jgi:hypothetical protein